MITRYTFKRIFRKAVKRFSGYGIIAILVFAIFYFVNNVIYGKLIWENAYKFQNAGDWRAAIELYNNAVKYYSATSVLNINKEKYIAVQYKKALCYLGLNKPNDADAAIKEGMYLITDTYGLKSVEYEQYIRQYVVEYYIRKKDFSTAKDYLRLAEYLYSALGTKNSGELAAINLLYGDLYNAMGQNGIASRYYQNAYRIAQTFDYTDIDTLIQTADRMGRLYKRNNNSQSAIIVYTKLLDKMNKRGYSDKSKLAMVKWMLADAYSKNGRDEAASSYYDEAYSIISKLPDKPEYFEIKQKLDNLRTDMARCYNAIGRYGSAAKVQKEIKNTQRI